MIEAEWLNLDDPYPRQLAVIQDYASIRKLRLIAAIFVRGAQPRPEHEEAKRCDDLIEAVADCPKPWEELKLELWRRPGNWRFTHVLTRDDEVVRTLRKLVAMDRSDATPTMGDLVRLIHEIVGNPFRPVIFDPTWRTDTVLSLARGMYESRDFSAMPILADALQDAGCEQPDILAHCCDEKQTHVRGCWVVDLVLNKE